MKIKERVIKMLKLFITPTSMVFEDLTDYMYSMLKRKYGLEFTIEEGEYKVEGSPEYLYKLIYKLSCDYDIEIV